MKKFSTDFPDKTEPDKDKSGVFVSFIIVSFNTRDLLQRCVDSIYKSTFGATFEIIVVDNGSSDGSPELMKKNNSWVTVIQNTENFGFARASNQGAARATGEYLFFLNSDTEVVSNAFRELASYLKKHADVGLVAPRLLNGDHSVQASCFHFPGIVNTVRAYWLGQKYLAAKFVPPGQQPMAVDAVVGAALMIPNRVFHEMNGFDERYFFYFEDLDLCRRLHQKGLAIIYYPRVSLVHFLGKSGEKAGSFRFLRESLLYPVKKILGTRQAGKTQEYLLESSIVYFGWFRHVLITLLIKLAPA
jgi:GT2 family glycosyltransferase